MKILWINHRDIEHPRSGGAERTIYEVGRRLVARGHSVFVLSGGWHGAPSRAVQDGILVRRFPTALGPHIVVYSEVNRVRPDVVVDDLAHGVPWFTPNFSLRPGVAFFHHLHRRTLHGQVGPLTAAVIVELEKLYPRVYRRWRFVTESAGSLGDLRGLGVRSNSCSRVPPGVDTEVFYPRFKSSRPSVVYFGGMKRYKRPENALLAFHKLEQFGIDADLTMIGDGPEIPRLRLLSTKLGIAARTEFTGRVSQEGLAETLGRAWVTIHCSSAEGWGFSVMEAAASGVPTVAYDVPGIRESIRDQVTGYLVPDGDVSSMAESVAKVIHDPNPWSHRCRSWAESFPWDRAADAWEAVLSSAVTTAFDSLQSDPLTEVDAKRIVPQ